MTRARARILVVDDIEENRDLLARRLRRRGHEASTAEGGAEALEMLNTDPFDLVLLDVRMPGQSGIEVLEEIRKHQKATELPVLMVSAETGTNEVVRALQLGANDYVTKPIDFPIALARIEAQLSLAEESRRAVAESVSAPEDLPPGYVLDDRYEIRDVIGEGGFAVVYHAVQVSSGQEVALKVMRADRLGSAEGAETEVARFTQEVQLIGRIRHPHIVRLIDSGTLSVTPRRRARQDGTTTAVEAPAAIAAGKQDGRQATDVPYLVVEYLRGESLDTYLKREGRRSVSEAVDLLLPVLSAADHAHHEGIVHRDLKPPNIFLTRHPDGRIKPLVLDFGIAKLRDESVPQLTVTSAVIGTPDYMSPEQARGVAVCPRADIYTLAAVLYECLTGVRPIRANSLVELIQKVAAAEIDDPRQHAPGLPDELAEVVLRAMAPEPEARYATAAQFAAALLPYASERGQGEWSNVFESAWTR